MGRRPIPILLKVTSKDDKKYSKPVVFRSIPEAASALGFSERGIGKAYHAKRAFMTAVNGNVYDFEWIEPRIKKPVSLPQVDSTNCYICGEPLTGEDRKREGISIGEINRSDGTPEEYTYCKSLYEAVKNTGLSLCALINASNKGNKYVTKRTGKVPIKYSIRWTRAHQSCSEERDRQRFYQREREKEREEAEERERNKERLAIQAERMVRESEEGASRVQKREEREKKEVEMMAKRRSISMAEKRIEKERKEKERKKYLEDLTERIEKLRRDREKEVGKRGARNERRKSRYRKTYKKIRNITSHKLYLLTTPCILYSPPLALRSHLRRLYVCHHPRLTQPY